MIIQISFRVYLIRRSQALRALRELAIAKGKIKELKALFNNPTYHARLAHDEEERQKFSERIIVLLLTVNAIEGANILVRHAKRSMLDELEAMLDIVDPQSRRVKSLTLKRRTSNMPDGGVIQKEVAERVTQAFAKIWEKNKLKKKKKELSPQDAAMMIQIMFRAYLIRKSMALRALRELAIAKGKLKEVKALFNIYYYRPLTPDKEERQKFAERIIVLLLTVDAIEGVNIQVRVAKRPMVDELEAMLDVVDPQPGSGESLSLRRTFDIPDGVNQKEMEVGVAQVIRMLEYEDGSETFG
ncbi:putative IQ motif, EF-hand binding, BAG family molecular chaperone regulator/7/8 [Helianthus debilis subsp. tardiflorus]